MNIVYIISTIFLLITYMLLKKNNDKQNLLSGIIISIIMLFAYNIAVNVILYFIQAKLDLNILSVVNFIISFGILLKILKDKDIQKYYIDKVDLIIVIIILIVASAVAIYNYGFNIKIKHRTTDASSHYLASSDYWQYSTLTSKKNTDAFNYFGVTFLMPGSYINCGIMFKIFDSILDDVYFYKLFFLFDIFNWILSGLLMYVLLTMKSKKTKVKILALFFSFFYMFAYQLNSLVCGFSYLGLGLDFIIAILIVMKSDMKGLFKNILLFFLNFGLMFTYYYFAPVVFLTIFWQILQENKENGNKLFNLKNICNIIISLILPGIFGILYFVVMPKINKVSGINYINALLIDGSIYKNLITNLIPYLVLAEIFIIYNLKNKNKCIDFKFLILSLLFIIIALIGWKLNKISDYYYYKIYYFVFISLIISSFEVIKILVEQPKYKIATYILIAIYGIGLICSIILKNSLWIYDIYAANGAEMQLDYEVINKDEIEILKWYNNNLNDINNTNMKTLFIYNDDGNINGKCRWIYFITKNTYNFLDMIYDIGDINPIDELIQENKKYIVAFKNEYKMYDNYDNINEKITQYNLTILFQNDGGMVLQNPNVVE